MYSSHPTSSTALYRDVEVAENQCKELEKVVALVENNRQRFRHIDNVSGQTGTRDAGMR